MVDDRAAATQTQLDQWELHRDGEARHLKPGASRMYGVALPIPQLAPLTKAVGITPRNLAGGVAQHWLTVAEVRPPEAMQAASRVDPCAGCVIGWRENHR